MVPPALEPEVVVSRDTREECDFLASKPGHATVRAGDDPQLFRRHQGAPRAKVFAEPVRLAGQEKLNPAALPLDGYLDEVIGLITENPTPNEVVVDAARRLRFAERDGTYAELLEARSQPLNTLPGR